MSHPGSRHRRPAAAVLLGLALASAAGFAGSPAAVAGPGPAAEAPPQLQLPIRCRPGRDCWVVNLVDLDPGPGVKDYACGRHSYDGHKGTDIAIRDMKALAAGVEVVAAAGGEVLGTRDGMADVDVAITGKAAVKGRECGNGVVIAHGGGWETQYCHLRKGSVAVHRGDRVEAGQKLGLVGHSGDAQFPHLHLSVRLGKRVVDPFVGLERTRDCGVGPKPLWRADALQQLVGPMTAIFHVGFDDARPDANDARNDRIGDRPLSRTAPAIVLWADMYWPEAGDEMRFRIFLPDGRPMLDKKAIIAKPQARRFAFAGRKRPGAEWPAGTYRGEITLTRDAGKPGEHVFKADASVDVR